MTTTRRWEFKLASGASSSHRGTSYPYAPSGRKAVAVPLESDDHTTPSMATPAIQYPVEVVR